MVRMEGRKGLFRIKRVDSQRGGADLVRRSGQRELFEMSVPFKLIQSLPGAASNAIQQFLQSESVHGGTAIPSP